MEKKNVNCPVCNSTNKKSIYTDYNIVQCNDCNVIYPDFIYTKNSMKMLYQTYADNSHMSLPKNVYEVKDHGLCRKYFFNEMVKYVSKGSLLDVGCGWGAYLYNARENGYSVCGLEYTKKCVDYANDVLKIKVYNNDLLEINFDNNSFDVVVMCHVLEHLSDQRGVFLKLKDIIKRDGYFCGIVPNIGSFCSKQNLGKWYWLDPNYHYVHYTVDTLTETFKKYGFEVQNIYTTLDDYDINDVYRYISIAYNIDINNISELNYRKDLLEKMNMGESIRFFVKNVK